MKLKNVLIVVKDMERSCRFYHDLFGLQVLQDLDGNVILTEGLVLQDEKIWKTFLGREIVPENNACELYFEEERLEAFIEKLEKLWPDILEKGDPYYNPNLSILDGWYRLKEE
jgi:catechol 2,3-dioxygenase-like lactoylglutathione lyase family enzyme